MTTLESKGDFQVTVQPGALGAEIYEIDISKPMSDQMFERIESIFHKYAVIAIRGQNISEAEHVAFSRRFGELEIHVLKQYLDNGFPEIHVVSNIVDGGKPIGIADAGRIWHADYSYKEVPARASLLYAREVPEDDDGNSIGDTMFVSTSAAYDALPDKLKQRLEGLKAIHNYGKYYNKKRQEGSTRSALNIDQIREVKDGIAQPVIRRHPYTGKKCIYASEGITTGGIVGMSSEQSEKLLSELYAHLYRDEFIYRHNWRVGDLLVWDNCSTQHCAIGDYSASQRRRMHRTTVRGREAAY